MKYISFLIKPASSLCNMRCRYCFYYDVADHREVRSHGIMQEDTMQALIERALGLDGEADITFAFQGGEPTVAGIDYFRAFTSYVDAHKQRQTIHYALQTNATLLDEEWVALFQQQQFLIGVSLDGYAALHDHLRKDAAYEGTFKRVMRSVELLKRAKVDFNILTVLSSYVSAHPQKLFSFYQKHDLKYIQFIPCLAGLDEQESEFSLHPRQFASFYKVFFDLWYREYVKGNVISVTLFDNVIPMFAGYPPQQCGMLGHCAPQFVVESNGDVYPCDFYVLDQYRCGNVRENTLLELATCETMKGFLKEPRRSCAACGDCPFEGMCHRNCKRLNSAYYDDRYCGYRELLEYAGERMQQIARTLR